MVSAFHDRTMMEGCQEEFFFVPMTFCSPQIFDTTSLAVLHIGFRRKNTQENTHRVIVNMEKTPLSYFLTVAVQKKEKLFKDILKI